MQLLLFFTFIFSFFLHDSAAYLSLTFFFCIQDPQTFIFFFCYFLSMCICSNVCCTLLLRTGFLIIMVDHACTICVISLQVTYYIFYYKASKYLLFLFHNQNQQSDHQTSMQISCGLSNR